MTVLSFVSLLLPMTAVGEMPILSPPIRVKPDDVRRTFAGTGDEHRRAVAELARARRAFETTVDDAITRENLRRALRQMAWSDRLRDPSYRHFVQSLKPSEALDLYVEVLEKLGTAFADRNRALPSVLFRFGIEELDKSLGDSEFAALHFPTLAPDRLESLRRSLRTRATTIAGIGDARDAVFELVRTAGRDYGLTAPTAVVLEFLCGACRRIDDYSEFIYPQADESPPMPDQPSVLDAMMLPGKVGFGYIRIVRFRDSTPRELDDALEQLRMQGLRGLIVDLRGNPGGLLTAAVAAASRFQGHGIIAATTGRSPEFADRVFSSDTGLSALDVPLVVLIDRRTMSAAEVVAAAWKESGRAFLVGLSTFGKGAVQSTPVALHAADRPDATGRSGKLLITVARVFGPGKVAIDRVGVQPHHEESDPIRQLETAVVKLQELAAMGR